MIFFLKENKRKILVIIGRWGEKSEKFVFWKGVCFMGW